MLFVVSEIDPEGSHPALKCLDSWFNHALMIDVVDIFADGLRR